MSTDDLEQPEPIEYDPAEVLTPEEYEEIRLKERLEDERRQHLDNLLWTKFSGHFGRSGDLVIPIRHREDE